MAYRHPNEMKENKQLLEECMHDAVHCALNEVMPTVMEEMESVLDQKFEDLKSSMKSSDGLPATQPVAKDFSYGVIIGGAIGAYLFIGMVTGIIIAKLF